MSHKAYHVRTTALQILHAVFVQHDKAKSTLEHLITQQAWQTRDIGLLREMVYGVLRHYYALEADISRFIRQKPDEHARLALLLGAYQLRYMRVPQHAAVSETVTAIKGFSPRDAGFVNAVLRQVLAHEAPTKLKPYQRAELPKWMYSLWRDAFGMEQAQAIGLACQHPPDLCLAIFSAREDWRKEAETAGFEAKNGELSPYSLLLSSKTPVLDLPAYAEGGFVVMDQAAQVAALAVKMVKEDGVLLDLCASPGGKTALLAHRFPKANMLALELNPRRLPRLQSNIDRLPSTNIRIINADCASLPFANHSVDAIMLDAPCSASGTLRRHPDAKFLHQPQDVQDASVLQKRLVNEAMRVLKSGGSLVYAVCSIHPDENEAV
ncbi:MAG: transcription antitermination factor NusB, partial [Ghiorsea sp.]